jgi:PAS domain S-box-containing protein
MAGVPGVALSLGFLWLGAYAAKVQWTVSVLLLGSWIGFTLAVHRGVIRPLQTLSNMLGAIREGDFSIRARGAGPKDPLGLVLMEANALEEILREQRLGAVEAEAWLRKVLVDIDVAVFAFDSEEKLRLLNRAGERLLGQPAERAVGRTAEELHLREGLEGEAPRTLEVSLPGGTGRWELRRGVVRQEGQPYQLLVLSDLSRALREEERLVWQRLVRVLSHEINNSLAPIKSIAASLTDLMSREPRPTDLDEDLERGLSVITGRTEALGRFMASYARLARLPRPTLGPVRVEEWIRRVAALETRLEVQVAAGPDVTIQADADQLEQLLINLIRNAVDASLDTRGGVEVSWSLGNGTLEVVVEDDGPGLGAGSNLFVPFYTTKPGGSGIGLVLSRQIAETHGGSLSLENRRGRKGAQARLELPVDPRLEDS